MYSSSEDISHVCILISSVTCIQVCTTSSCNFFLCGCLCICHEYYGMLQVAFDGIGSMPMARIENYRQVKQEAVDFEMKRRNARKNLDHAIIASPQGQEMQTAGSPCTFAHHHINTLHAHTDMLLSFGLAHLCLLSNNFGTCVEYPNDAGLSGVAERVKLKYTK